MLKENKRCHDLRERLARIDRAETMKILGYKSAKPEDGDTKGLDYRVVDALLADPEIKEALEILEFKRQGKLVKLAHGNKDILGNPIKATNIKDKEQLWVEPL
jgi:hypothetical protein